MQHKTYDPCALLRPTPASHRILVVLNAPIEDHDLLEQAFEACSIRICADGGANRVHDFLRAKSTISSAGKPRDESGMEDVERLVSCFPQILFHLLVILCILVMAVGMIKE